MQKPFYLYFLLIFGLLISQESQAQSNQYLHFDGQNDKTITENAASYIINSTEMSMTGWFYSERHGFGQGMFGFRSTKGGFYMLQLDNGKIECRFVNSEGTVTDIVAPTNSVIVGQWQHMTMTYGNDTLKAYIDGELIQAKEAYGVIDNPKLPFGIGTSPTPNFSFYFQGGIDEVSLWSKTLSQAEIKDIMANELAGNEANLELYYKFDQGTPDTDNSSIDELLNSSTAGERNAQILNMDLSGETSNFKGDVAPDFQWIDFKKVMTKVTTDQAFELEAASSVDLPITYELLSGPASLDGTTLTLDGTAGKVKILAKQEGDGTYKAATPVIREFDVVDPIANVPVITPMAPTEDFGVIFLSELNPLRFGAQVDIPYSERFWIEEVRFVVNGDTIIAKDWENGNYTAWWHPENDNLTRVTMIAESNFGTITEETLNFLITTDSGTPFRIEGIQNEWIANFRETSITKSINLPVHHGLFNKITAKLDVSCPPTGGCGEWDIIANVYAKGYDGQWFNIIRYITPYGKACEHSIDLTHYASILNGKTDIRIDYLSYDNGYVFDLDFEFEYGETDYQYSHIVPLWNGIYPFGEYGNLQPTKTMEIAVPENAEAANLQLLASGHGWGNNNTSNAAEFSDNTHHVYVNGSSTFEQRNWNVCNPNPDDCSFQAGTWEYSRAGWCPGAIAPYFDFDLNPYLKEESFTLDYVFDENYIDLCNAAHPDCVSGQTCNDCNDGFNPTLHVISNVVFYSNTIPISNLATGMEELPAGSYYMSPNPTNGLVTVTFTSALQLDRISVYNSLGQQILQTKDAQFDLSDQAAGLYLVEIKTMDGRVKMEKVLLIL